MKWVLVDLSFIAHKARWTMKDLEFEDVPTGVLYGFFEQLYDICKHFKSNKVLIFTDSKKSYRLRSFSGYKYKRKEDRTEEELQQLKIMYKQVRKLKNKILPKLGFPVYQQVGLESDDLIAMAAKQITQAEQEAIIITSDFDLLQCITPYITWYDPGKELLMDENSFRKKYGVKPNQFGMVKAIGGCASDSVPGLKGVGEGGAIKYLRGEIPKHWKQYQTISKGKKEIKKWGKLTILPHKKTKPVFIEEPEYNSKMFFSFCKHYGIMSYVEVPKKIQWIKFFEGKFKRKLKRRKRR